MLAWRLRCEKGLSDFDPSYMVRTAAAYLIRNGPVTQQERWEEASGYSPSTLASNIAALVCASVFMREAGDNETAAFIEEYADYLESHIEDWTLTTTGSLLEGESSYYMRILPEQVGQQNPAEDKEERILHIANHAPGEECDFPARNVVDGGFLELVRYGIRSPDDPNIVATIKVMDAVIKTDTPQGPTWHRYNHDGYGQGHDGAPFTQYGVGRVWPLLTGERGHYELAAGNSTEKYIRTMEGLASNTGLLPEQSWDEADRPEIYEWLGKPTGSAMPLMWAHAEYIKLLRSTADGKVYDAIPEVAERYLGKRNDRTRLEVWKPTRQVRFMRAGEVLRVHGDAPFTLRWSSDNWKTVNDSKSTQNALQLDYVDLKDAADQSGDVSLLHVSLDGRQSLGRPELRSYCSLAASRGIRTIEFRGGCTVQLRQRRTVWPESINGFTSSAAMHPLRTAFQHHWRLYVDEGVELAIFMISACFFTVWLFDPALPALASFCPAARCEDS